MADLTVVKDNGVTSLFRAEFKDRGVDKTVDFNGPSGAKTFKEYVASLSDVRTKDGDKEVESDMEWAYGEFMYALKTHAIQSEREQVAQESTIIKRDGRSIDLMEIPVAKAILVINAGFAMAAATESEPQTALSAARRKLLENGKVKEVNDTLVAA